MNNLPEAAKKLLKNPDVRALAFEMTQEKRDRMLKASVAIVEVLADQTESPVEGFMVLKSTMEALAHKCGIADAYLFSDTDEAKQHS